ncbi:uncharacterized protein LOC130113025 [Lampris incognitus]|uniref:uncharacterized protein LOC130113025 n=1 Tax=Lampris incognitus TaxID=2546036 RepID=UPI0024B61363|nr:uncharacterized protein LOC130113025 [Lampris incognitus]
MMAKVLNDGKILRLLETDVRSRELFYHRKCHSRYRNRYSSASCRIKQERTSSQNSPDMIQYAEYIAMEEVGNFIDDSSENVFDLHKLENIYLQKVEDLGFDRPKSHSTRFAEKLSNSCLDINVVQKETGAHYRVIKKGSLDNVISDSDFLDSLCKVTKPVRAEVIKNRRDSESTRLSDLSTEGLRMKSNFKLKMLMSLLCDGTARYEDLPMHLEQLCQTPGVRMHEPDDLVWKPQHKWLTHGWITERAYWAQAQEPKGSGGP